MSFSADFLCGSVNKSGFLRSSPKVLRASKLIDPPAILGPAGILDLLYLSLSTLSQSTKSPVCGWYILSVVAHDARLPGPNSRSVASSVMSLSMIKRMSMVRQPRCDSRTPAGALRIVGIPGLNISRL